VCERVCACVSVCERVCVCVYIADIKEESIGLKKYSNME